MLIDAHCHIWQIGENDHEWPTPDLAGIYRNYSLRDLDCVASPAGVEGVVVVQSQPSERDTAWLLDTCAHEPLVKGVVGWTSLAAINAGERILQLAQNPLLKGLRPMLQDLPADWVLSPALDGAFEAMVGAGLTLDALIKPAHLEAMLIFAERWPDLSIVVDHGAKPQIRDEALDPWRAQISALADHPNLFCKVSGLLTEARDDQGIDALTPYVEHLRDSFGPSRLMWGSDWPVLNLASSYGAWSTACKFWFTDEEVNLVFSETAKRFYRL